MPQNKNEWAFFEKLPVQEHIQSKKNQDMRVGLFKINESVLIWSSYHRAVLNGIRYHWYSIVCAVAVLEHML